MLLGTSYSSSPPNLLNQLCTQRIQYFPKKFLNTFKRWVFSMNYVVVKTLMFPLFAKSFLPSVMVLLVKIVYGESLYLTHQV